MDNRNNDILKNSLVHTEEAFKQYHKSLLDILEHFDETSQEEWEQGLTRLAEEMAEITIKEYFDAIKIWDIYVLGHNKAESLEESRKMKYASSLSDYIFKVRESVWNLFENFNFQLVNIATGNASETQLESIYHAKESFEKFEGELESLYTMARG